MKQPPNLKIHNSNLKKKKNAGYIKLWNLKRQL